MRLAYGFGRSEADFEHLKYDRLYIDDRSSKRSARAEILDELRRRSKLLVLARIDLGRGRENAIVLRQISQIGAKLLVCPAPNPGQALRPDRFRPSPSQDKEYRRLWNDPKLNGSYVIQRVAERYGFTGSSTNLRNALHYRYGPRFKP